MAAMVITIVPHAMHKEGRMTSAIVRLTVDDIDRVVVNVKAIGRHRSQMIS